MARIQILSKSEYESYNSQPIFTHEDRVDVFQINSGARDFIDKMISVTNKVGFVLQWGYFKRSGRFFSHKRFHVQDIKFVIRHSWH